MFQTHFRRYCRITDSVLAQWKESINIRHMWIPILRLTTYCVLFTDFLCHVFSSLWNVLLFHLSFSSSSFSSSSFLSSFSPSFSPSSPPPLYSSFCGKRWKWDTSVFESKEVPLASHGLGFYAHSED